MDKVGNTNHAFTPCDLDVGLYSKCQDDAEARRQSKTLEAGHVDKAVQRSRPIRRRWVCLAVGAALAVLGVAALVVVLPAVIMNGGTSGHGALDGKKMAVLEDILDDVYAPQWFNGTWETDTMFSYMSKSGQVWLYDMEAMTSINLLLNDTLIPKPKFKYMLSADLKYLLVGYNYTKRFRHVFSGLYSIIDLEAQTTVPIVNGLGLPDPEVLQHVTWAPRGNGFAYVYRNNLYYRPSAKNATEFTITSSGIPGVVYNGATDWVYSDAVYSSPRAVWFSTNGTRLAYATFNDSLVHDEPIPFYGSTQYSHVVDLKYPKAGTTNPNVTVSVVLLEDVTNGNFTVFHIAPPENVSEPLLAAVSWANDEEVAVLWKNRVQNIAWVILCNAVDSKCREVWREEEAAGWTGIFGSPQFSADGTRMLLTMSHEQDGDAGKYRHVTMIYLNETEPLVVPLTAGIFTVTEILAWDEGDQIYFSATEEGDSARLQVFTVPDQSSGAPHVAECISCGRRTEGGDVECLYSTAYFSKENSFYMFHCWGPDIPEISFYNKDHVRVALWEDNHLLRDRISHTVTYTSMRTQVPLPGGFQAQVKMWLPPNMDPTKKYPLLVDVYAGPDSYQISERFEIDWRLHMTTNRSVVYAVIDGRGTGLKGDRMLFATYRKLGTVEMEDQIIVTKFLLDEYSFLDSERTAIWGWSYGGYSTLMTLANDTSGVFKCGISVAPVTDWTYYTTLYAERSMGLPTADDNLVGYQRANVNDKIDNLRHKKLLLVHGTFDNIALYHNSMVFAKAMQIKSIQFQQQSYPDEDHALSGVLHHLYQTMNTFLDECFA